MITVTFWPRAARAGTVNVDLTYTSRFETGPKNSTFFLCNSDSQHLLDAMWASGMRPSHLNNSRREHSNDA